MVTAMLGPGRRPSHILPLSLPQRHSPIPGHQKKLTLASCPSVPYSLLFLEQLKQVLSAPSGLSCAWPNFVRLVFTRDPQQEVEACGGWGSPAVGAPVGTGCVLCQAVG